MTKNSYEHLTIRIKITEKLLNKTINLKVKYDLHRLEIIRFVDPHFYHKTNFLKSELIIDKGSITLFLQHI